MSYTRTQVETILIQRCGPLMETAGMDMYPVSGFYDGLNDPIGFAMRKLSYSVADITSVANSDVSAVTTDDLDALLDLAELRLLQNVLGNFDAVDTTVGPRTEKLSQLRDGLEVRIDKLSAAISSDYGIGGTALQAGTIGLDIADHNEDLA